MTLRRTIPRNMATAAAMAVAMVLAVGFPCRAQDSQINYDRHAEAIERSARRELSPKPTEEEKIRHELVRQAFQKEAEAGSWSAIKGKKLTFLHLRQAALAALVKNLTIEASRDDRIKAGDAIEEARAVFDPVFGLSINYNESQTFRRAKIGSVNKKSFSPTDIANIPTTKTPGVTGINFRSQLEAFDVSQEIEASEDSAEGPTRVLTYSVTVDQQLPWGPVLSLSNVTKAQKIYYRKGFYWEDGGYSSTMTLNLSSGVPFGKGVGPFAPADANLKLQEQAEKSSEWVLRKAINDVLLSTDLAYWTLVRRIEELHATVNNRDLIGAQMKRVQRLFSLRRATNYEKAEIEAEFAKANVQVENARNKYVGASNDLAVLIENKVEDVQTRVYLPFGYTKSLDERLQTDLDAAMATAGKNRPDIFINRIGRKSAEISLKASETAARPDIAVASSLTHEQNGSLFGYRDFWESITHLNRPDIITQNYSLTLSRPWGNASAEANVDQARLSMRDQDAVIHQTNQTVAREISDPLASMGSARVRLKRAGNEVARLEKSLEGLRKRREIGADVTQNEIILTTRSLLTAELGRISALIDNKIAESRLLAAEGTLAKEYGARTVINDLDKKRIEGLTAKGFLSFFRPSITVALPIKQ